MPTAFERALAHTTGLEGGYSNHPSDSGGQTRYGITEKVARAFGYGGPMTELPFDLAARIYKEQYWDSLLLDEVSSLSLPLAMELFDSAVNVGVPTASRWLQRSLNVLNRQQVDFGDVVVDGRVGRVTLAALRAYLTKRKSEGETVLLRMLNSLQGAFYVELAERREKDEDFIYGWFRTRVVI
jgi:lysozyme family protein